jgi:hypothetical protein
MGAEKIEAFYNDPAKCWSDAHSLRSSLFLKRAAVGQTALWRAFRWGCYAGSVGRNFVRHGQLPRFPASSPILKETLHSGI